MEVPKYEVIPFTNFARHEVPLKGGQSQNEEEKKQPPVSSLIVLQRPIDATNDVNQKTFTYCYPTCGATTTPQGFYMMKSAVPYDLLKTLI